MSVMPIPMVVIPMVIIPMVIIPMMVIYRGDAGSVGDDTR